MLCGARRTCGGGSQLLRSVVLARDHDLIRGAWNTLLVSEALIVRKRRRLPLPVGPMGNGAAAARQVDAALSSVGFKLSGELIGALSGLAPETVVDAGQRLLAVVREMVGDHVSHNVYFKDFPANVPDTMDFWIQCIREGLEDSKRRDTILAQLSRGTVNLLDLPRYGRYQHSFEEMVAAHDELIPLLSDRVTVIGLGAQLADEERSLYLALAGSPTPLSADDLEALRSFAEACAAGLQPEAIPVRENRAVINKVRLKRNTRLLVDSPTDILRLACELSEGDVTLVEPTRFRSFRRSERRALLRALDEVVTDPAKLGDIDVHRERWKRLGERLHPHEFQDRYERAAEVFEVARRARRVPSLTARVEQAYQVQDLAGVLALYRSAPGVFFRGLDRLLRAATLESDRDLVIHAAEDALSGVSARVILSMREHLDNRCTAAGVRRIFTNRSGRAWATPDERDPLDGPVIARLVAAMDAEVAQRLPTIKHLVVDRDVLDVALPLSSKSMPPGVGLLPRGSVSPVDAELLRFFVYWRESRATTDFDLSALLLNENYQNPTWLSYTNLTTVGGRHSGDITEAPEGATEFIDLQLSKLTSRVVVPQVNIYSGEGFDDVAESFFGFMNRETEQKGLPFEPTTVRMKSDLRGPSRVALPLAFVRDDAGAWSAHWLHLFLYGKPAFNQVENNRVSTAELVRALVSRNYLTVRYLVQLLRPSTLTILETEQPRPTGPHTYLGPDSLAEIRALIPQ